MRPGKANFAEGNGGVFARRSGQTHKNTRRGQFPAVTRRQAVLVERGFRLPGEVIAAKVLQPGFSLKIKRLEKSGAGMTTAPTSLDSRKRGMGGTLREEASSIPQFKVFLSRYFYLCMSLVFAVLVVGVSAARSARTLSMVPRRGRCCCGFTALRSQLGWYSLSRSLRWSASTGCTGTASWAGLEPGSPQQWFLWALLRPLS